jgi:hypothetical protein
VLLKVMTFTTDVGSDFIAIGESNSGVFTSSRVRFFRSHGTNTGTDTFLLRSADSAFLLVKRIPSLTESRSLGFVKRLFSLVSDQLINSRHFFPPGSLNLNKVPIAHNPGCFLLFP